MKEYVLLSQNATIEDKLRILSDAAKYDVEWSGGEMEKIWEVLRLPESVILLREMADVSPF